MSLDHDKSMVLSNNFEMVQKLAFSSASAFKRKILQGPSDKKVPTITLAIDFPFTSIVSLIDAHIFFLQYVALFHAYIHRSNHQCMFFLNVHSLDLT